MSGGVDSSVTAALLLERGFQVTGLFMKNWEEDDEDECHAAQDLEDAGEVCRTLDIPLKTVNFSYEYWERVFVGFLQDLKAGRTPNPDIICNVEIKFREFPDWARKLGANYAATGHYARIHRNDRVTRLLKGVDAKKDQSYFLHGVDGTALNQAIFPLGNMTKTEVRQKAKQLGLQNHDKKGSAGICFIGRRNFSSFIRRYLPSAEGLITNECGTVLGRHQGAFLYTIGQRTGLGIGGPGDAWYVAGKDIASNTVIAVQGHDHPLLYSRSATVSSINWISGSPRLPLEAIAKIRYQGADQQCLVTTAKENHFQVEFAIPVRAVTPGQSIVFYHGDICLGGGAIDSALRCVDARVTDSC